MSQTAARLLGLLSLLMVPRTWSGTELADRLGVSPRTIRSDIGTLRELGYPIQGTRGGEGGYRLGNGGSAIPPLLLDPSEAIAVAVGLHAGLSCIIGGMQETSAKALTKLEQILPTRIRRRVQSLAHFTVPLPGNHPMPLVDPNVIVDLIEHCQAHERLRFTYLDADSAERGHGIADDDTGTIPTFRDAAVRSAEDGDERTVDIEVEPYRLVNREHRWYLLTFDTTAEEWRIFQVERIVPKVPRGRRFTPRTLPADDISAYVEGIITTDRWRHSATVTVEAPAEELMTMLVPAEGMITELDDHRSTVVIGAERLSTMALTLARLDVEFTVEDSPELTAELESLSARLLRAAGSQSATVTVN